MDSTRNTPLIRPYASADRAVVRQICCDTADRGEPVENFFPDRELVADLVTRYYTDFDSCATWVAEAEGRVVAYLTGCLDTAQWRRTMWRIVPAAVLAAMGRGVLGHRQTWRFLGSVLKSSRGRVDVAEYPAHVHVNVASGFRGGEIGRLLLERFFAHAGATGVHANVRADNERGRHFFEQMGFVPLNSTGATIVYAKKR